ncbi:MAG TPA: maleylpyruvate isomerase family mycothiol-dependent enzyme [Acidimicrobiia bacterium]|nr:maleylpyruvate isomerase family mycothiol-dependent enzyme [Acidimicrobiia bacterium]
MAAEIAPRPSDDIAGLRNDLEAEQRCLVDDLRGVEADDWFTVTAAEGWDVRDTVAHLADTDEIAIDTCTDGPRSLTRLATALASAEDVTLWGVLEGRRQPGPEVLAWWEDAQDRERSVLASLDPAMRVPWGLGMRVPSFLTARLMETWAHGLDVRTALGLASPDTARLRHVAWLAIRALPYAYQVASREPPASLPRVELRGPDDVTWTYGPADAPARITGDAGEFCRLFVRRLSRGDAHTLRAEGADADAALDVARAYL